MFTALKTQLTPSEFDMVNVLIADSRSRTVAVDFLRKRFQLPQRAASMMVQTWNDPDEGGFPPSKYSRSAASNIHSDAVAFGSLLFLMAMAMLSAGVVLG